MDERQSSRAPMVVALGICFAMLVGGFFLKAQCFQDFEIRSTERVCYNDIQPLYEGRDLNLKIFPYIYGYAAERRLEYGALEYPVLTGMFMWATALLVDTENAYFVVSAISLAPFALLAALLLAHMAGRRALFWAAAPAIVLYAFHNWDLLVVAAAVVGMWLWWRGYPMWAAVAYGVGAAFKWYPVILILPLALQVWRDAGARRAWWTVAAGFGTTALINLPFAYLNPPSWWITYAFHRARGPNADSLWGLFAEDASPALLNAVTGALMLVSFAVILWWTWKRSQAEGVTPVLAASGALVAAFLLWNKVQSPQYTLWILPFFVVLDVRLKWWVFYSIVDIAAYVAVFRFFFDFAQGETLTPAGFVMVLAVLARSVLLAVLAVLFARADHAPGLARRQGAGSQLVSHPPSIVPASEV